MLRRTLLAVVTAAHATVAHALYDPTPSALLASAPGAWSGTLTYRDWSKPDRLVTLRCRLSASLTSPEELALYFVFDDGPGKTVYSYERMAFDFKAGTVTWASGISKPNSAQYAITSATSDADGATILFERSSDGQTDKFTLLIRQASFSLGHVEQGASGAQTFRNRYELVRGEGGKDVRAK